MEGDGLLAAICADPTDWQVQLVYADWLAERGHAEETAWRWVAAFRRRPCPFALYRIDRDPYWALAGQKYLLPDQQEGGRGWGNWGGWELPWPWSAGLSMLPAPLFRHLPKTSNPFDGGHRDERAYGSTLEAFQAIVTAFGRATRPRRNRLDRLWNGPTWEPDWALAAEVPDEG